MLWNRRPCRAGKRRSRLAGRAPAGPLAVPHSGADPAVPFRRAPVPAVRLRPCIRRRPVGAGAAEAIHAGLPAVSGLTLLLIWLLPARPELRQYGVLLAQGVGQLCMLFWNLGVLVFRQKKLLSPEKAEKGAEDFIQPL